MAMMKAKRTKVSQAYWKQRQDERIAYSERISNQTIHNIAKVYDDSIERVNKKIDDIMRNYAKELEVPQDFLDMLLSQHDVDELLRQLTEDLINNGANTQENMEWLRGNYLKRLSNEQAIKMQLENERRIVANAEQLISKGGYSQTIEEIYKSLAGDLVGAPRTLSETSKEAMLNKRWVASKNYSERVWNNTGKLYEDVNTVINSGLISGRSRIDIQRDIAERHDVAMFRSEVLVRTEMNYFANDAELRSYHDFGVTHYIYFATRDNRTSEICSDLDQQRFKVSEAQAGVNYPPMHPNCRSTTLPDFDSIEDTQNIEITEPNLYNEGEETIGVEESKEIDYFNGEYKDYGLSIEDAKTRLEEEFGLTFEETSRTKLGKTALNQTYGVLKQFEDLYNVLPDKVPALAAVPKSKAKGSMAYYAYRPTNTGKAEPSEFGFNVAYFKNSEVLIDRINHNVDVGFFSKNKSPQRVVLHELAHHIDKQMRNITESNFVRDLFVELEEGYGYDYFEIAKETGGYAGAYFKKRRSHTETFAELFAEAYGDTPRTMADDFKEVLEKRIKEALKDD